MWGPEENDSKPVPPVASPLGEEVSSGKDGYRFTKPESILYILHFLNSPDDNIMKVSAQHTKHTCRNDRKSHLGSCWFKYCDISLTRAYF